MAITESAAEWQRVKFADIAESITERVDDPKAAGVEIYVGLEHLDSNTTRISRFGAPDDVEATKLRFYPGDVIYARRRAYQRKLGVAEVEGICSAHALVLRARPEVCLPEFLPYFLQSDQFHERALEISVGSLSPTINWKTLRVQEFALPPVEEQQRIAEVINMLDLAIQSWQQVSSATEIARTSFCYEQLQLLRSSCKELPLSEVSTVIMGQSPPGSSYNTAGEGIPFIQGSGEFGEESPTPVQWTSDPKHVAEVGDLLFSVRAPVGDINVAKERIAIGRGLSIIRPNRGLSGEFIYAALTYQLMEMRKDITGGVFDSITGTKLKVLLVPFPEPETQEWFVERFNRFNNLLRECIAQIAALKVARKNLLRSRLEAQNV
jgi:restriction endonuclease S subunit